MDGRSGIFDEPEREVLAAWFVKTSLVAGAKFRPLRPIFYEQFQAERKPSANTRVWLAGTTDASALHGLPTDPNAGLRRECTGRSERR